MDVFERHEQFQMEVLDGLQKNGCLSRMVLGGSTMLRLCHQMPRFSSDLTFFLKEPWQDFGGDFNTIKVCLKTLGCDLVVAKEKHFSWFTEAKRSDASKPLVIEIRKDDRWALDHETRIAFSPFLPKLQVRLSVCSLSQMWHNKVEALLSNKAIYDAYDLDYLLSLDAGDPRALDLKSRELLSRVVEGFTQKDIKTKLKTVIPPDELNRFLTARFAQLKEKIEQARFDM